MRGMKKTIILAVFVLVFSMLFPYLAINNTVSLSDPTATVRIDLPETHPQQYEDFGVNIMVSEVTNLWGFSIEFYYLDILEFREADGNRSMLDASSMQWNCTSADKVDVDLLPTETNPRNGSGMLVTLNFYCSNVGSGLMFACNCTLYMLGKKPVSCPQVTAEYSVEPIHRTYLIYKNWTLPGDINNFTEMGPVFAVMANNVVFDLNGHTINNSIGAGYGIDVQNRNHVTIKNGTITNFQYGIQITGCDQVDIFNIKILNSLDYAMKIEKSSNVRIYNNIVSNNKLECVSLSNCSLSEVSHNILSNNGFYGIDMRNSISNTISNNTILNNTRAGIYIQDSNQNKIFNNNFINNKPKHVSVNDIYKTSTNDWNSNYPRGGNYWDDWNDTARPFQSTRIVDEKSGENQTISGPDGIGDTAYVINENNRDEYPLMNRCGSALQVYDIRRVLVPPPGKNRTTTILSVAVFTNSSVANFNFNSNGTLGLINFNVSGQCTFCKVIVSRELLEGVLEIKVDGVPVASFLNWDEGYIFANFTYPIGSHPVRIWGEIARQCDINGDGKVSILDISLVAKEYGSTYYYENP